MRDALIAVKDRGQAEDLPVQAPDSEADSPPEPTRESPKEAKNQKRFPTPWVILGILLLVSGILIYALHHGQPPIPDKNVPTAGISSETPVSTGRTSRGAGEQADPSATPSGSEGSDASRIDTLMDIVNQSSLSQYHAEEAAAQDENTEGESNE